MEHLHEHKHKWYTFGCKDATYLIEKRNFAGLNFSEKLLLSFHKLICKFCRRFENQTQKINNLFKTASESGKNTLSEQKKQSINQLITEASKK